MSTRLMYLLGLVIICSLLLTSLYFQYFQGIMPCPLCTLQRISFGFIGILFLIGIFVSRRHKASLIINTLAGLFSALGIFFAGRQVWLQHFPPSDNSDCGVSLQYMLQVLPVNQALQKIFQGSAECTQRGWEFLHMNMAEWALIWFVLFLLMIFCLFMEEIKWKK
jgi:disulfide bond formation protein DsbB